MHDDRRFKVSVNVRIGRTARLSERLRRYVKSRLTRQRDGGQHLQRRRHAPLNGSLFFDGRSNREGGSLSKGALKDHLKDWIAVRKVISRRELHLDLRFDPLPAVSGNDLVVAI